jgi:thioredoxin 1
MAAAGVIELNDANFATEVLESDTPVLVDFWAPWCGPCRMIAPTIDQIASESQGQYRVGKLNTDDGAQTAMQYSITAIPALIIFKNGKEVWRHLGVASKSEIKSALAEAS